MFINLFVFHETLAKPLDNVDTVLENTPTPDSDPPSGDYVDRPQKAPRTQAKLQRSKFYRAAAILERSFLHGIRTAREVDGGVDTIEQKEAVRQGALRRDELTDDFALCSPRREHKNAGD